MRRALLHELPHLTHFYHGAIHPLNVDEYTNRELSVYIRTMRATQQDQDREVI